MSQPESARRIGDVAGGVIGEAALNVGAARQSRPRTAHPFARVPLRAPADRRLTGRLLALLSIISFHDRGDGCTASNARLGRMSGYAATSVPAAVSRLISLGYIVDRAGRAGRQRCRHRRLFVVWTEDDDRAADPTAASPDEEWTVGIGLREHAESMRAQERARSTARR
jgi:hypothetical protein